LAGSIPGTVLGADAESLQVATWQGILRLRRLQRPGGKMLSAGEFLRGFPVPPGTVVPSLPMPVLVGPAPFPRNKA
jgi:methionyl-tRNA formyltransferase